VPGRPAEYRGPVRHRSFHLPGPAPLYCEELRPDREPARWLLMVHGGAMSGACWLGTPDGRPGWAQRFVAHGFGVLVPDWPGVGRSGPAGRPVTGELVCEVLGGLLEHVGHEVVLLVHSMAGPFGYRLVQAHPERVAALVAVAPGPPGNLQPEPEIIGETPEYVDIQGSHLRYRLPRAGDWLPSREFLEAKLVGASRRYPRHALDAAEAALLPVAATLLAQRQNLRRSQLRVERPDGFAGKPVLVLTGSADTEHPRELDEAVADWLAGLGAAVDFRFLDSPDVAGNGHMPMHEDNSDEVADQIAAWMSRLP
jgi:pimeloyl-ACP methyl ester carboxylesterase